MDYEKEQLLRAYAKAKKIRADMLAKVKEEQPRYVLLKTFVALSGLITMAVCYSLLR